MHFFDCEADAGPEVRRIAFIEWHIVTRQERDRRSENQNPLIRIGKVLEKDINNEP